MNDQISKSNEKDKKKTKTKTKQKIIIYRILEFAFSMRQDGVSQEGLFIQTFRNKILTSNMVNISARIRCPETVI